MNSYSEIDPSGAAEDLSNHIAIVSLTCRFPGVRTLDEFWEVLQNGTETIDLPQTADDSKKDGVIGIRGYLDNATQFDAPFFGFSRREAEIMDPQYRLFLEATWELLEKAGYNPFSYDGTIGIFAGSGFGTYLINNILGNKRLIDTVGEIQTRISNDKDSFTPLLAYKLNLKGPCATVQTSCSTSLVAVHLGCESLLNFQCDLVICGGITLTFPKIENYEAQLNGLVSNDGHIRAFDANASGTIYSDGLGIVLLKRFSDAMADGDTIFAVIEGTAINASGFDRASFAAPGVKGQTAVITEAMEMAGISPQDIDYVEAHGSGTPLGDAIEVEALTTAFQSHPPKWGYCCLGSVKTNIGHTQETAGIAGLIKATLALHNKILPPTLNFDEPNPNIKLIDSPFFIPTEASKWEKNGASRRASVNSFGMGGVNAHVILKEAPEKRQSGFGFSYELVVLSAKTESALSTTIRNLHHYMKVNAQEPSNLAFTLKVGRKRWNHRAAFVVNTEEPLLTQFEKQLAENHYQTVNDRDDAGFEFVFSQNSLFQSSQLSQLYHQIPLLRSLVDELIPLVDRKTGFDLSIVLSGSQKQANPDQDVLLSFLTQYFMAMLLMAWGIKPQSLAGEGIGQMVCACLAKTVSIEEVLNSIQQRPTTPIPLNSKDATIPCRTIAEINSHAGQSHTDEETSIIAADNSELAVVTLGLVALDKPDAGNRLHHNLTKNAAEIDGMELLQRLLACLWLEGVSIDWVNVYEGQQRNRIELPTYPFEHQRYFVEPATPSSEVLSKPDKTRSQSAADGYSLAEIQEQVKTVWEEALGTKIDDLKESFFILGGHSLLATQILFALRDNFQLDIPMPKFFEAPTVIGISEFIHDRQKEVSKDFEPLPQVEAVPEDLHQPFPLTDVQKAYFIGREIDLELSNIATHMYFENDLKELSLERFNQALLKVIDHHEMLRAIVLPNATQKILPEVPTYNITTTDLRGVSEAERDVAIEKIRKEMSHQVFASDQWPLFDIRATLLDHQITRLHFSLDLLILDAWSMELFLRDISLFYMEPDFNYVQPSITFRDYVIALEKINQSALYEKSRAYWLERMKNLPPAPQLPLVKSPGSIKQPTFKRRSHSIERSTWQRLRQKSNQAGITPTILMLSAFAEVLSLWCKDQHFTLNLTLFNRLPMHPQVNDLIGDFTALTLLEIDNTEPLPFIERARAKQSQIWKDMDHRYFNGVRVTRELLYQRKNPAEAIMPVVFTSLLNQEEAELKPFEYSFADLENIEESDLYSVSQTPQVWLDHQIIERQGIILFNFDVVEGLIEDSVMDDMFATYCQFLDQLAANDDIWESIRPLQPEKERFTYQKSLSGVLAQHNERFPFSAKSLHSDFVLQATKTPQAEAIVTSTESITYGELYNCSCAIANEVKNLRCREDSLVAVYMPKTWQQIPAVLGILMSGAAYLPIDASMPIPRVKELLAIGEVEVIITSKEQNLDYKPPNQLNRIEVAKEMCRNSIPNQPNWMVDPLSLAYVIFTSGSTGKPKGVMIDHQSALNTIEDINRRFTISQEDTILGISSLSFDLSVYDVFGMLAVGGRIVLPDSDRLRDPSHWSSLALKHGVTIWNSVPALMKMLIEYKEVQDYPELRLCLLSGDWVPLDLPDQIEALNPGSVEVVTLGGATEASIWSILYPVRVIEPDWKGIPYGRSMTNQQISVMNSRFETCPVGVAGELYISGAGLALGYWKDKEKTDSHFLVHPVNGKRLYRTGDWGRYKSDGTIEFLGREDQQVKIGGYRIELGEIETAIKEIPMVQDAVVATEGEKFENKRLSAFVTFKSEDAQGIATDSDENLLLDPLERLNFKISEPGRRQFDSQRCVSLAKGLAPKQFIERRSYRVFIDEPICFSSFSLFLECLSQRTIEGLPIPKYHYSSGGGLYPVQIYLFIKADRIESVSKGLYYYDAKHHQLQLMRSETSIQKSMFAVMNQPVFDQAAFAIFLISQQAAIEPMYGKKQGLHYAKLEAGIITHALEMNASEHHLGLCQIGEIDFERIKPDFELDQTHHYLHCLLGGKIAEQQKSQAGFLEEWDAFQNQSNKDKNLQDTTSSFEKGIIVYLRERLPHYMIPGSVQIVDTFPLNPNGKVDIKKLLEESKSLGEPTETSEEFVVPRTELEVAVAEIWLEFAETAEISINDNFFEKGGDSVMLVRFITRLNETLDLNLPLQAFLLNPTIKGITEYTNKGGETALPQTDVSVTVESVALPDSVVVPQTFPRSNMNQQRILLTGASGLVGSFLLRELLQSTNATVVCLVRAKDLADATFRIKQQLEDFKIWSESFVNRIVAIPGDLSLPNLGLSSDVYADLARTVDVIYHAGAMVNHLLPYPQFVDTNVNGTISILELATSFQIKPVHHISTTTVFGFAEGQRTVDEDSPIGSEKISVTQGYNASKWIAEGLVLEAADRGLPCKIYRLDRVIGDSQNGLGDSEDFFARFVQSCAALKSYPAEMPLEQLIPVDTVAQAIVFLSNTVQPENRRIFHLMHPQPIALSQVMSWYRDNRNPLKKVNFIDWLTRVEESLKENNSLPIAIYIPFFHETIKQIKKGILRPTIECKKTLSHLKPGSIHFPELDEVFMNKYFENLVEKGECTT